MRHQLTSDAFLVL